MPQSKPKAGSQNGWPVKTWVFLGFLVTFLTVVIPVFTILFWATDQEFRSYVYGEDRDRARLYAAVLEKTSISTWEDAVKKLWDTYPDSRSERLVLLGTNGRVEWDTSGKLFHSDHPLEHLADAVPLNQEGRIWGFLLVGTMVDPALTHNHSAYINRLVWTLLALLVGALVLGAAAAQILSFLISRPIGELAAAARTKAEFQWKNLGMPLPKEIQDLGDSLRRMEVSLEEAENRKARILADAAHELRTPLTVMRGTLEALVDGIFPPTAEILTPLYQETLRLQKIVETIRTLEEMHRSSHSTQKIDLQAFLREMKDFFQSQSLDSGTQIFLQGEESVSLATDPEALKQIFFNLLSNAFKYGKPSGTILLSASRSETGVLLYVEDDGPGIPPEERENIFERFYRLDPSRSQGSGGRGLGLSIVLELTRSLGGKVWVEAGRWGGARFNLYFGDEKPETP